MIFKEIEWLNIWSLCFFFIFLSLTGPSLFVKSHPLDEWFATNNGSIDKKSDAEVSPILIPKHEVTEAPKKTQEKRTERQPSTTVLPKSTKINTNFIGNSSKLGKKEREGLESSEKTLVTDASRKPQEKTTGGNTSTTGLPKSTKVNVSFIGNPSKLGKKNESLESLESTLINPLKPIESKADLVTNSSKLEKRSKSNENSRTSTLTDKKNCNEKDHDCSLCKIFEAFVPFAQTSIESLQPCLEKLINSGKSGSSDIAAGTSSKTCNLFWEKVREFLKPNSKICATEDDPEQQERPSKISSDQEKLEKAFLQICQTAHDPSTKDKMPDIYKSMLVLLPEGYCQKLLEKYDEEGNPIPETQKKADRLREGERGTDLSKVPGNSKEPGAILLNGEPEQHEKPRKISSDKVNPDRVFLLLCRTAYDPSTRDKMSETEKIMLDSLPEGYCEELFDKYDEEGNPVPKSQKKSGRPNEGESDDTESLETPSRNQHLYDKQPTPPLGDSGEANDGTRGNTRTGVPLAPLPTHIPNSPKAALTEGSPNDDSENLSFGGLHNDGNALGITNCPENHVSLDSASISKIVRELLDELSVEYVGQTSFVKRSKIQECNTPGHLTLP